MTACAVETGESEQNWLTHTYIVSKRLCRDVRLAIPLCACRASLYTSIRIINFRPPTLISRRCAAVVMLDDHVVQGSGRNALAPVSPLLVA